MTNKATEAHNRMQAEKAHAVNTMKAMARRHKVRSEDSAVVERYQRARIAALEIEVEELTRERDEARREVCKLQAELPEERLVVLNAGRMPIDLAAKRAWDCFKDGKP